MSASELYKSAYAKQNPIDLDLMPTDWSGTVVYDMPRVWWTNEKVLKYFKERGLYDGKIPTFDEWAQNMAYRCTSAVDNYIILGLDENLLGEANSLYKKFYEEARKKEIFEPVPYDGIYQTLECLVDDRAKVLGVVSAHPEISLDEEIKQYSLFGYFEFVEGGLNEWKDKAQKLTEVVEYFDVDPQKVGYLCDMPNDLKACHMAEVVPIVHARGWTPEPVLDEIIEELFVDEGREHRKFYEWTELTQIVT
jgi:phosphoglycolate phosphatase-like HAD superfamily hydrolase